MEKIRQIVSLISRIHLQRDRFVEERTHKFRGPGEIFEPVIRNVLPQPRLGLNLDKNLP